MSTVPNDDDEVPDPSDDEWNLPPPSTDDRPPDENRNLVAFWMFGLCNNFGYIVMLSAAYDILLKDNSETESMVSSGDSLNSTVATVAGRFDCNPISTGAVLLANVLPALAIRLAAPLFIGHISYNVVVCICVLGSFSSFLVVSYSRIVSVSLTGIAFASVSFGLGGFAFVSLTSFYERNAVSAWSSGTGASGLVSSLFYASLTEVLTPRQTVLIMLVVPVTMTISYCLALGQDLTTRPKQAASPSDEDATLLRDDSEEKSARAMHPADKEPLTFSERLSYMRHLLKYVVPLLFVYFAEYFINQGLLELIFFRGIWLDHQSQYRWFQVVYQMGTFISRSSVNVLKFDRIWILSIIQWVILAVVFAEVYFAFLPSIALICAIVFVEGFVGGMAYVNTFYLMWQNEPPKYKELAMGTTTVADLIGISMAGVLALPVHNAFCSMT